MYTTLFLWIVNWWNICLNRWQHNYNYTRRYCNPQQHSKKPSLSISHAHSAHQHGSSFMISQHRNSASAPFLQNNQCQSSNNQSNLRPIHTVEKRPSLQETNLEVSFYLVLEFFLLNWITGNFEKKKCSNSNCSELCNAPTACLAINFWDSRARHRRTLSRR